MNILKTISKIEKLTGCKIETNRVNQHWVTFRGYTISFFPNGRISDEAEATNFYTKKVGAEDDAQSDYYAGTFHDNITQAFNFVNRMAGRNSDKAGLSISFQ